MHVHVHKKSNYLDTTNNIENQVVEDQINKQQNKLISTPSRIHNIKKKILPKGQLTLSRFLIRQNHGENEKSNILRGKKRSIMPHDIGARWSASDTRLSIRSAPSMINVTMKTGDALDSEDSEFVTPVPLRRRNTFDVSEFNNTETDIHQADFMKDIDLTKNEFAAKRIRAYFSMDPLNKKFKQTINISNQ